MSSTPTNINLNDTVPVAKPDAINVEWQAGGAYPDPNDPTKLVRDATACYRVPQVGGIAVITADYQISGTDSGFTLIVNSASAVTLTMPAAPPSLASAANGVWNVWIRNLGAGQVTLDPKGINLDGSSSTLKINQNCAREISTDGTDYYSCIIASGVVGTVDARTTTSETISAASQQKLVTTSNASAVAVTLDSTVGAAFMCWLINLGAGTATLTPSSGTINGSASLAVTTGSGCALFFDGTNWKAVTGGGGGGGMTNPMTTLGDVIYEDATPTPARLAGNTTTTRKFLRQTGTGSASAVPAWDTLVAGDIPSLDTSKITTGQLALARGGTGVDLSASGGTTQVLAQDGSHVISARSLVAADIPNIAESQVTSLVSDLAALAPKASPALTGTPTAPTAAGGTNTTQIATTAFVEGELASYVSSASGATKAGVQQESYTYAADSGAVNAYAVTLSPVPSLAAGSKVIFKAANANTGASTLNVNGVGAKNIYKKTSASLVAGDILASQIIEVVYDGTNFQLTGNGATGSSPVVIGFVINNGAAGNNVGPMLQPARAGQVTKCAIVTKSSDGTTGLTFRIKQNGVDIFSADPTVAAATAAGTTTSSTSLTSNPLSVAVADVFQIDILSGSPNWAFTAQLET